MNDQSDFLKQLVAKLSEAGIPFMLVRNEVFPSYDEEATGDVF